MDCTTCSFLADTVSPQHHRNKNLVTPVSLSLSLSHLAHRNRSQSGPLSPSLLGPTGLCISFDTDSQCSLIGFVCEQWIFVEVHFAVASSVCKLVAGSLQFVLSPTPSPWKKHTCLQVETFTHETRSHDNQCAAPDGPCDNGKAPGAV